MNLSINHKLSFKLPSIKPSLSEPRKLISPPFHKTPLENIQLFVNLSKMKVIHQLYVNKSTLHQLLPYNVSNLFVLLWANDIDPKYYEYWSPFYNSNYLANYWKFSTSILKINLLYTLCRVLEIKKPPPWWAWKTIYGSSKILQTIESVNEAGTTSFERMYSGELLEKTTDTATTQTPSSSIWW